MTWAHCLKALDTMLLSHNNRNRPFLIFFFKTALKIANQSSNQNLITPLCLQFLLIYDEM